MNTDEHGEELTVDSSQYTDCRLSAVSCQLFTRVYLCSSVVKTASGELKIAGVDDAGFAGLDAADAEEFFAAALEFGFDFGK